MMRKAGTPIIILATCVLALGPLFGDFFGKAGYARWMLAQAANELQRGQVDQAKATLARALETSNEITSDADFWRLRFEIVFLREKVSDESMDELQRDATHSLATMDEPLRYGVAESLASLFAQNKRFEQAIDILQTAFPQINVRSADVNNELAYFRAILNRDLDLALKEVNAALATKPADAILDTKAWVLYRLGKYPAALNFANQAIAQRYLSLKKPAGQSLFPFGPKKDLFELFEPGPLELAAAEELKQDSAKAEAKKPKSSDSAAQEAIASDETQPETPVTKNPTELDRNVSPLDEIKKQFSSVSPVVLDDMAKHLATMRFHRACILDAMKRTDESELDYQWLDRFGFSDTSRLF